MMSMHSLMFLMIALLIAIALIGGLYVVVRLVGARVVDSDHPKS